MKRLVSILAALVLIISSLFVSCSTSAPSSTTTAPKPSATPTATQTKPTATPTASATGQPQYGGALKLGDEEVFPTSMGVPGKTSPTGIEIVNPILEHFFRIQTDGTLVPWLLSSYSTSQDGLKVTFNIRKGVKFQDGTDWNATAAKWNLETTAKSRAELAPITSMDILDDYTLVLNLKSYSNGLLPNLCFSQGFVSSPTSFQTNGEAYAATHPVGTGPYKLASFEPDVALKMAAFNGYWQQGKPYLDSIEIDEVKDNMAGEASFLAGEVDGLINTDTLSGADLRTKGYQITWFPWWLTAIYYDSANAKSPFGDVRVRQAVEAAIDKASIVKNLGNGFWVSSNQIAAKPGLIGYDPSIPANDYDPQKAQQLLTAAGYPNGFSTEIIAPSSASQDPIVAVQNQLSKVGITAKITLCDSALWNSYGVDKTWTNGMLWDPNPPQDPAFETLLMRNLSSTSRGHSSVLKNFDDLLNQMDVAKDPATEKSLAQQVVRRVYDQALASPIYIDASIAATTAKVNNLGFFVTHVRIWTPEDVWKSK